jgi:hypothetical protein
MRGGEFRLLKVHWMIALALPVETLKSVLFHQPSFSWQAACVVFWL